jgi:hypothetical protein
MGSTITVTPAMIDAQRQDVACLERQLARAKHELCILQDAYATGKAIPV